MAADGSQPTRLTRNERLTTGPLRGRPTARRLPLTSTRDGNREIGNWEIYVMAADGSQPTRLTRNSAWRRVPLRGRPTARRLPFTPNATATREIYVMAAKPETSGDDGGDEGGGDSGEFRSLTTVGLESLECKLSGQLFVW